MAYQKFTGEEFIDTELTPKLNDNFDAVRSGNAGTVFPTENLVIGMKFFDTSSNKEYTLVNLNPIEWREIAYAEEVALLNQANTYTAFNTFTANIRVSNGTAAGSQGSINFGIKPANKTTQASITALTSGSMYYTSTEGTGHLFRVGSSNDVCTIAGGRDSFLLQAFHTSIATYTPTAGAKFLGNANTATKLETARTITANLASSTAGSFDGSANITVGVTGTLPIANGGTGATTAAAARTALGCAPAYTYSTTDLTAGSSKLTTGTLYIVYE